MSIDLVDESNHEVEENFQSSSVQNLDDEYDSNLNEDRDDSRNEQLEDFSSSEDDLNQESENEEFSSSDDEYVSLNEMEMDDFLLDQGWCKLIRSGSTFFSQVSLDKFCY